MSISCEMFTLRLTSGLGAELGWTWEARDSEMAKAGLGNM
jgi:hypothetical protein